MRLCRPRFLATLLQRFKFCCVTWDKLFNLSVPHPPYQVRNSHTVGRLCRLIHFQHLDQCPAKRESFDCTHTHTHTRMYIHPNCQQLIFPLSLVCESLSIFCNSAISSLLSAFFVPVGFGVFFFFLNPFIVPPVRYGQTVESRVYVHFTMWNHKSQQLACFLCLS